MSRFTLICLMVGAFSAPARADLTLVLTPQNRPAAPNGVVTFQGTLTNTSTTSKLFLNDIQASLTSGTTTLKSNAFFNNVPGILLPGEVYDGPLFAIKLEASVASGNYSGSVTLNGGSTIFANTLLATSALTLLATPVEQWRFRTFGDAAVGTSAADTADFDHDGVPNLIEYALSMNATLMDRNALPKPVTLSDHLTLSYLPAATDVNYFVEASTDLVLWSGTNIEQVSIANPTPPGSLTFRYKTPLSNTGRVFLRLRVAR